MSVRECDNLRSYLISNDQYKKTGRFKENIKQGNVEIIPVVLETIESMITNKNEEPISRLNALRLLKECVDLDSQTFNFNVEISLLNTLYAFAIQLDRKALLKANPTQQEEKISMSFYILCLESIKVWAHQYPSHKGIPSQFNKMYQKLKSNGFKFPQKLNFFRDIDLYKNNLTGKGEYMHKNIKAQLQILKNLPDIEDTQLAINTLKELDYFLRHANEISQNHHEEIPEQITQNINKYKSIVACLHQNLNDYKKGNLNYSSMRNQILNNIHNFESSMLHRSSEFLTSTKRISPNSSEIFDLKYDNMIQISQQNLQTSQSFLDEKQINTIINIGKNQMSNTSSLNRFGLNNSIDSTEIEYKSNNSPQQSQQLIHQRTNGQSSPNTQDATTFDRYDLLEQKQYNQSQEIEQLKNANIKLQSLIGQKQDDMNMLENKKTQLSSSSADYHNLLQAHEKLEQDHKELVHKYNNIQQDNLLLTKDNGLLSEENEHLKKQQVTLKEMTRTLNNQILSLQKDIKIKDGERATKLRDIERKYQTNQLLAQNQLSNKEQPSTTISYNRLDDPANYHSTPSSNSVRFSEKDFMRGQTVSKNQQLLSFLNQEEEGNSLQYKLCCLGQSRNIYEDEYINILMSKIDQSEINKNVRLSIPIQMGLNIQVFSKSNININNFEMRYHSNNTLSIISDNRKSLFLSNSSAIFSDKIYIESSTIPFQIPQMTIKYEVNQIKKAIDIALPISMNDMIEYDVIKSPYLNDFIAMWNNSSADTILKSSVFTVNKQLIDQKTTLQTFFPTFSHVQSSSINYYELVGLIKIPQLNNSPAAVKITLINDRFICFQIKLVSAGVNAGEKSAVLKKIETNTLQYIIQTYQELFSNQ